MPKTTQEAPARNFSPNELTRKWGVAPAKVIHWIRTGELRALNLANRGCTRPRFSIPVEAKADFERQRSVIPEGGESPTRRLRRKAATPSG